jgi:hypothetical protein
LDLNPLGVTSIASLMGLTPAALAARKQKKKVQRQEQGEWQQSALCTLKKFVKAQANIGFELYLLLEEKNVNG